MYQVFLLYYIRSSQFLWHFPRFSSLLRHHEWKPCLDGHWLLFSIFCHENEVVCLTYFCPPPKWILSNLDRSIDRWMNDSIGMASSSEILCNSCHRRGSMTRMPLQSYCRCNLVTFLHGFFSSKSFVSLSQNVVYRKCKANLFDHILMFFIVFNDLLRGLTW